MSRARKEPMARQAALLRITKAIHTAAWAFFASCIVAIPIAAWRMEFPAAFVLAAMVSIECLILVANHWRCPLTDVAARYTDDRTDNFDIYLPAWLARYNKLIFGALFVAGVLFAFGMWLRS